jgi:hypothetical protein
LQISNLGLYSYWWIDEGKWINVPVMDAQVVQIGLAVIGLAYCCYDCNVHIDILTFDFYLSSVFGVKCGFLIVSFHLC